MTTTLSTKNKKVNKPVSAASSKASKVAIPKTAAKNVPATKTVAAKAKSAKKEAVVVVVEEKEEEEETESAVEEDEQEEEEEEDEVKVFLPYKEDASSDSESESDSDSVLDLEFEEVSVSGNIAGDEEIELEKKEKKGGLPLPSAVNAKARSAASSNNSSSSSTTTNQAGEKLSPILYLGHIPHGFYEEEMTSYFEQFGPLENLRLCRNKKTGASKHFAFIEFKSLEVSKIVQETMDNYLLFNHLLICKLLTVKEVDLKGGSKVLFKGADRKFKPLPWNKMERERMNRVRTEAETHRQGRRLVKGEEKRRKRLEEALGEPYLFEGYTALLGERGKKSVVEKEFKAVVEEKVAVKGKPKAAKVEAVKEVKEVKIAEEKGDKKTKVGGKKVSPAPVPAALVPVEEKSVEKESLPSKKRKAVASVPAPVVVAAEVKSVKKVKKTMKGGK